MGEQVHITGVAERFSSHTQMCSRARGQSSAGDPQALRERLIAAAVEIIAAGGDPRLDKTRALA